MQFIIIENTPSKAFIYEQAGIERIMVDLEVLGKAERQRGYNSVKSNHSFDDIKLIRQKLTKSSLMVRINPWNPNSPQEIDKVIDLGADIIMLPMFKKFEEVDEFIAKINGRAKTNLLLETPEAFFKTEEFLRKGGFDELFVGLNDLSLGMSLNFMFELLADGLVDHVANLCSRYSTPFGFGGIGTLQSGEISGLSVIQQHARLGSSLVILSQTFKSEVDRLNLNIADQINLIRLEYQKSLKLSLEEQTLLKENVFNKIWEISKRRIEGLKT